MKISERVTFLITLAVFFWCFGPCVWDLITNNLSTPQPYLARIVAAGILMFIIVVSPFAVVVAGRLGETTWNWLFRLIARHL